MVIDVDMDVVINFDVDVGVNVGDINFGGDVFGLLKGRIRRIRRIPFKGTYTTYTY